MYGPDELTSRWPVFSCHLRAMKHVDVLTSGDVEAGVRHRIADEDA